jgi:AcrR family transcriptional regulator
MKPSPPRPGPGSPAFLTAGERSPGRRRRPTSATAFEAAVAAFLAGERLDMQTLAARLEISRTTLYRWTGQREQLLTDVLCHLAQRLLDQSRAHAEGRSGSDRIIAVLDHYLQSLARSRAMRAFLHQETHIALRLLTGRGRVQDLTIAAVVRLLREEEAAGQFTARADVDTLAFGIVRFTEGFVYTDAAFDREPQIDRAESVIRILLG